MGENAVVFSLTEVITAIDAASDDCLWFANTETGVVDCHAGSLISGEEHEGETFEGEEWVSLPGKYERNDWRTMSDFACELGGPEGEELLDAIHGRGAFRAFRRCVENMGILQSWYAYKDERRCQMAVEWLDSHGFAWSDDRREISKRDWRALLPEALKAQIELSVLGLHLSICKLSALPEDLPSGGLFAMVRTDEELSVVCETASAPIGAIAREDGWRALKVAGPLDFELVGILAKISTALADAKVPLFALSTFDTDYILVKEEKLDDAVEALRFERCAVSE